MNLWGWGTLPHHYTFEWEPRPLRSRVLTILKQTVGPMALTLLVLTEYLGLDSYTSPTAARLNGSHVRYGHL